MPFWTQEFCTGLKVVVQSVSGLLGSAEGWQEREEGKEEKKGKEDDEEEKKDKKSKKEKKEEKKEESEDVKMEDKKARTKGKGRDWCR